jgi:hypothetical protein
MAIRKILLCTAAMFPSAWYESAASAAPVSIANGQAVNDSAQNVTWLANANLASTQTFGVEGINKDGSMSWDTAQKWISAMNAAHYLGSSQWTLPTTQLPDGGCSQSTTKGGIIWLWLYGKSNGGIVL